MQEEVFQRGAGPEPLTLVAQIRDNPGEVELWLAEYDGQVVCAGRLDIVSGTAFAGLWGGATLPRWRGHGLYRALTAARARSAEALGVRYLHSDCSPMSRPILERSGLVAITTTTPYVWTRD
jgi:GNAT superfamily N-acetyltransferase